MEETATQDGEQGFHSAGLAGCFVRYIGNVIENISVCFVGLQAVSVSIECFRIYLSTIDRLYFCNHTSFLRGDTKLEALIMREKMADQIYFNMLVFVYLLALCRCL